MRLRRLRRLRWVFVLALGASTALGQGTAPSIQLTPQWPTLGTASSARIVGAPGPIASVAWYYAVGDGTCGTQPLALQGTGTTAPVYAVVPGIYSVGALVQPVAIPPARTATPYGLTTTTGSGPPTGVRVQSGRDTPAEYGGSIAVISQLMAGSATVGPYLLGEVQEKIVSGQLYNGASINPTTWAPSSPGPNFGLQGSRLIDQQFCLVPDWDTIPVGTTVLTWTQGLRYVWTQSCFATGGVETKSASLGSQTWRWVKVSRMSWEIQ